MNTVILASSSPRRRELLARTGLKFEVIESGYEEDNTLPLPPNELVMELARGKAAWVAEQHPEAIVIGADTLVALDGAVLGKPHSQAEIFDMITLLSGRSHTVVTGLAIIRGDQVVNDYTEARIHFRELSLSERQWYAALPDGLDKAGGYGVQTTAALFLDRVEGDYMGVVGLSLARLAVRLKEFGVDVLS